MRCLLAGGLIVLIAAMAGARVYDGYMGSTDGDYFGSVVVRGKQHGGRFRGRVKCRNGYCLARQGRVLIDCRGRSAAGAFVSRNVACVGISSCGGAFAYELLFVCDNGVIGGLDFEPR